MFGRVFLLLSGILSIFILLFFGYQLIHNQHTLSPESLFNAQDGEVCIINHTEELNLKVLDFTFPKNENELVSKIIQSPCYSERIYISGKRNRILIELKTPWNEKLVSAYFQIKKISTKKINGVFKLENGFFANYSGNYLCIGKQILETENWNAITWPVWDKMASFNVINLRHNLQSKDVYIQDKNKITYHSTFYSKDYINKINDYNLFAHVIPTGINQYHFIEKNYAVTIGLMRKSDLLYQWCDKGIVQFEIDGIPVMISDFKTTTDPFELLDEETEEEEVISGGKSAYDGIKIATNYPTKANGTFYIKYIEDKVVISENKDAVNQVLAYYETGRTVALSSKYKKLIYDNLPSSVCERAILENRKFTRTIYHSKLIEVVKSSQGILKSTNENSIDAETIPTNTFSTEEEIVSIVGSGNIQFCWSDKRIFGLKDGKEIWSKNYEGELVGSPIQNDLIPDEEGQILFTTSKKIYLLDQKGNTFKGFPILLKNKPCSQATVFSSKKGTQFIVATSNNELTKFSSQGKKLKTIKLSISPSIVPLFVFKNGKKNMCVITGSNGGQLIQLDNLSKHNSFPSLDKQTVFCSTSETPALFYPENNRLIRNEFSGKTKNIGSFPNIELLRSQNNPTKSYITFISEKHFYISDDTGTIIRKIELPSSSINDYQLFTLQDGSSIVVFLDGIENSVYLYSSKGKKLLKNALEGRDLVNLSEIEDDIVISTKGNNLIIQYKISK
jgi:hypothetical protein